MSKTLALLSGKGGSGKTTLALSMATMLADCGIRVLLVDCDLSTNGATYFYEEKIINDVTQITSFFDVVHNSINTYNFITINANFDFLPSVSRIEEENIISYSWNENKIHGWNCFLNYISSEYDIVLFDCQAGYTDLLKLMLPSIDISLFVMETDAISSAAMRSMYLKIGDIISKKKVYQLFNKATEEEAQVYSQLSGGTVFTNIETVIFDWKIRKAFSVAQVPDMKNTSIGYGKQVYNICKILFSSPMLLKKLQDFQAYLLLHENYETEKELQHSILLLKQQQQALKKKRIRSIITTLFPALFSIAFLLVSVLEPILFKSELFGDKLSFFAVILTMASISLFGLISSTETFKENQEYYSELQIYRKKLDNIIDQRLILENKSKESKSSG